MVLLLDSEEDPGGHALSRRARGSSKGFVLANGQHDEYPDEHTVPLALRIISHILTTGTPRPLTPPGQSTADEAGTWGSV